MRQRNPRHGTGWKARPTPGSRAIKRRSSRPAPEQRGSWRGPSTLIVALYLLLSAAIATATVRFMHGRSDPPATRIRAMIAAPKAKYLVLMVLDGARPDYFGLTTLPHVDALRNAGTEYTNAFAGILETETPAGHATIATGSTPARDGILGFDWSQNDTDYSIFSPDIVRAGAIEHIMASARVPTIAGLFKAAHPGAQVVALSGHKYYAADPLGGPDADAIMYYQGDAQGRYVPVAIPGHTPPPGVLDAPGLVGPSTHLPFGTEDHLVTRLALSAFHVMRQQITLINYPEFDWPLGHVDGGNIDPKDVITLMRDFDHDLAMIENVYRRAGVLKQTLFVITADHGMSPIQRFVPQSVITNAVAQAGTTAPAISFSTGTYVWLTDASKARAVAQNILAARDPGIESAYYLSTVNGRPRYVRAGGSLVSASVATAYQNLLGTLINGHQPDVVAFCRAHATTSSQTSNWKADHGGQDWQSQHVPLIFSGPGIASGVVTSAPAQLEDVAPTALTALGVRPTGMQGHVLTEAISHPAKLLVARRAAEIRQVDPLVNALIAQDRYEGTHGNVK